MNDQTRQDEAYRIWKRRIFQQPCRCGLAGCALVLVTVIVTLFGAIVLAVLVHSSGMNSIRALGAKMLAIPLVGAGLVAFFVLRPLAWKFSREYRELQKASNAEDVFIVPDKRFHGP